MTWWWIGVVNLSGFLGTIVRWSVQVGDEKEA
jgi:hypothetical protein